MTRMGFALSIVPKFMDVIVCWVTRDFAEIDNHIDDLLTPSADAEQVVEKMQDYGLPTKDREPLTQSCVLAQRFGVGGTCPDRTES